MFKARRHTIEVADTVLAMRTGQLVLVDVREHGERARGFAPGSQHLPLSELKQRVAELPDDRPIAFICESGRRSALATTAALRAGLDARNVRGGMATWQRQGLHIEMETA